MGSRIASVARLSSGVCLRPPAAVKSCAMWTSRRQADENSTCTYGPSGAKTCISKSSGGHSSCGLWSYCFKFAPVWVMS